MGVLIADSGSTKTDWLLAETSTRIQTSGINPFFRTSEDIYQELEDELLPHVKGHLDAIYFYGAGIISQERGSVIQSALNQLFPGVYAETHGDVLGASRALFGSKPGIACILGTGSNTCLYDGEKVITGIPPLGFILGDECSGAVLGKKLLGDYFKNVMPTDVQTLFEKEFVVTEAEVLQKVYKEERPNQYLAGFTPFLSKYIEKQYCLQLVTSSITEFFERNVIQIPEAKEFPLGFVGSVAWNFRAFIQEMALVYGFNDPLILKSPVEKLKEYHATT